MPLNPFEIPKSLSCSELFGGVSNCDTELISGSLRLSIFSQSHRGAKGGDICYVGRCSNGIISRILLADVLGHGDVVSGISEKVYRLLLAHMNSVDNSQILMKLNEHLQTDGYQSITSALIFTHVRDESKYYIASAGHPQAYIFRSATGVWSPIVITGEGVANLPLGATIETSYSEYIMDAVLGDRIFLYTDGLIEVSSPSGTVLGIDGAIEQLSGSDDMPIEILKANLIDHIRAYSRNPENSAWIDDVTVILAELGPPTGADAAA